MNCKKSILLLMVVLMIVSIAIFTPQDVLASDNTIIAWGSNSYGQTAVPTGLSGVTAIAAGRHHTVVLKSDGTVVAWGNNSSGQTTVPTGLSGVTTIAAGGSHTAALKSDGTVVAWGNNSSGQTTVPTGLSSVATLAAGGLHTVALKSDGTVVAWGDNSSGQTIVPTGLSGVTAIAAGGSHTVALKSDGTVVAWGNNGSGRTTVPTGLNGVTAIAAGGSHTVALKSDGTVVAWGSNIFGLTTVPSGLSGAAAIAAGEFHTVALLQGQPAPIALAGIAPTSGANNDGKITGADDSMEYRLLGTVAYTAVETGTTEITGLAAGIYEVRYAAKTGYNISAAVKVEVPAYVTIIAWGNNWYGQTTVSTGLSGVTAIAAGGSHTVALKSDGTVVAWGENNSGQATIPTGLSDVTAIAAGYRHTVTLKGDGTVVAWGDNSSGQTTVPIGLSGVTAIAAGGSHTVALKSDGTVVAWGSNEYSQAAEPSWLNGVTAIAAGYGHTVVLKSDGTVVAWGNNDYGQTIVPYGLNGVTAIAAGGLHTVVLKRDGTVVAWGNNDYGQTIVPYGLNDVSAIAAGTVHTVVLKSDGNVVAWGYNEYGQTTVPTGVNGGAAIAAGEYHTVALLQGQPAPIALAGIAPTSGANDDGKITGADDSMEYRLLGTVAYTDVETGATEITGLAAGIYEVRYAAKTGYNISAAVKVEVPAYVPEIVVALTTSNPSVTGFTVALNPAIAGLTANDFTLLDSLGAPVTIKDAATTNEGATYAISATLGTGQTYTVTAVRDGYDFATADVTTLNPAVIQFSAANTIVSEETVSMAVEVIRSGNVSSTVAVDYSTQEGTAVTGEDYTLTAGTLTFEPNETSKTINLTLINDSNFEPAESFSVALSKPGSGDELGDNSQILITIEENDYLEGTGTITYLDFEGGFFGILGDDGEKYRPLRLLGKVKEGDIVNFKWIEAGSDGGDLSYQMWGKSIRVIDLEVVGNINQQRQDIPSQDLPSRDFKPQNPQLENSQPEIDLPDIHRNEPIVPVPLLNYREPKLFLIFIK